MLISVPRWSIGGFDPLGSLTQWGVNPSRITYLHCLTARRQIWNLTSLLCFGLFTMYVGYHERDNAELSSRFMFLPTSTVLARSAVDSSGDGAPLYHNHFALPWKSEWILHQKRVCSCRYQMFHKGICSKLHLLLLWCRLYWHRKIYLLMDAWRCARLQGRACLSGSLWVGCIVWYPVLLSKLAPHTGLWPPLASQEYGPPMYAWSSDAFEGRQHLRYLELIPEISRNHKRRQNYPITYCLSGYTLESHSRVVWRSSRVGNGAWAFQCPCDRS